MPKGSEKPYKSIVSSLYGNFLTRIDKEIYNIGMKNIIQFTIEKGQDGYYVASANDYAIVTQAKTMEELFGNIKEATELHFEDAEEETPVSRTPSIFINYEMPVSLHA
jgi:predicted RNase H-like HicB family nuclease